MENIKFYVSENPSLFDKKIKIYISGLNPSSKYTLHSSTHSGKHQFECFSHYLSDNEGLVDLMLHPSHGGSYKGVEPMGLFWTLQCLSEDEIPKRLLKRDVTEPVVVTITVYENWLSSLRDISHCPSSFKVKSFQVARMYMTPGVRRIEVQRDGLVATLFLPPGKGPFPGLINMFGGMAGTLEYKPALYASHGFAALALPYSGIKGLPEGIFHLEMEYFEKAIHYLQDHPEVDCTSGVGVVGICKGAQVAFAMADCLTGISCIVAINGPCVAAHTSHQYKDRVWKDLFNDENQEKMIRTKNQGVICRYGFQYKPDDPVHQASLFNFHKKRDIGYMYIAGLDDDDVPSEFYANLIERLLKSENHSNFRILRYPGAGHLIEAPFTPNVVASTFHGWDVTLRYGGVPVAHCRAQEDAWDKQLEFLCDNLCRRALAKPKL